MEHAEEFERKVPDIFSFIFFVAYIIFCIFVVIRNVNSLKEYEQ